MSVSDSFRGFVGSEVVIDTDSTYVFIGKLTDVTDHTLTLADVDVHDRSESTSTKEKYVMEAKKFGIKKNRRQVTVRTDSVICVSRLEDVIEY